MAGTPAWGLGTHYYLLEVQRTRMLRNVTQGPTSGRRLREEDIKTKMDMGFGTWNVRSLYVVLQKESTELAHF
jgi:hypothetical protein